MKTIGLMGGMSWESSIEYYRIINELVKEKLGGLHSAKSVMVSVDFAPLEAQMAAGEWDQVLGYLVRAAEEIEAGGADFLLMATNTMHKLFDEVGKAVKIPLVHIVDAAAAKIQEMGLSKVGLLGTIYTMEQDFYRGRLEEKFGIEVIVPEKADRELVDRIIFEELVAGKILAQSKAEYVRMIEGLAAAGAQGVVLGCTEIPLLIGAEDVSVPVFDTTYLHAKMAVEIALGERELS
ncbi:MAG: aspartate/glutamate racemase family protein [Anaerolineales bacterium]|nr:aspartate/glutamate racemase family protein [Anaerolineales bacterium]